MYYFFIFSIMYISPLLTTLFCFFLILRPPLRSTLFPYTTLFRSKNVDTLIKAFARLSRSLRESHDLVLTGGLYQIDRKSTRLNSSHEWISYAVFCLKKKKKTKQCNNEIRQNKSRVATCKDTRFCY